MTDSPIDAPHVYIGAYALCVRDGHMLLARIGPGRFESGQWALPGGGLNWGEDPADAVLRELTEETGLTGAAPRLADIFSTTYLRSPENPFNSVHQMGILYVVETLTGELRDEQNGSTDQCAWFPLEDLGALPLVDVARFGYEVVMRRASAAAPD